MIGRPSSRLILILAGFLGLLAGTRPALAQELSVRTDKGCGIEAVYEIGEAIRISFSSSQTTSGRLTLGRPDGAAVTLFSGTLQGGVTYVIAGRVGAPNGTRTLTLTAGSGAAASATCEYIAGTPKATAEEARVLGILSFDGMQDAITAPGSVGVNEEFQVTVTTLGSGCERQGDEGVILAESGATVTVYDFTSATRPGVPCTTILKRFAHIVTLRFAQAGEKVIRVIGRRVAPDAPPGGVPLVLEQRVMVQ
jgi:hypothetical protein